MVLSLSLKEQPKINIEKNRNRISLTSLVKFEKLKQFIIYNFFFFLLEIIIKFGSLKIIIHLLYNIYKSSNKYLSRK